MACTTFQGWLEADPVHVIMLLIYGFAVSNRSVVVK